MPSPSKVQKSDERPDAWKRFERAVDAGLKTPPLHREKPKPKKRKARRSLAKATIIIFGLLGAGNYATAETLNVNEYNKLAGSHGKLIQLDLDIGESLIAVVRQKMGRGAGTSGGWFRTFGCLMRVATYMDVTREWLHVILAKWGIAIYFSGSPSMILADNDIEETRQNLKDQLGKTRSEINAVQGDCRNHQLVMSKTNAVLALVIEIQDQMTEIDRRLISERLSRK